MSGEEVKAQVMEAMEVDYVTDSMYGHTVHDARAAIADCKVLTREEARQISESLLGIGQSGRLRMSDAREVVSAALLLTPEQTP